MYCSFCTYNNFGNFGVGRRESTVRKNPSLVQLSRVRTESNRTKSGGNNPSELSRISCSTVSPSGGACVTLLCDVALDSKHE